MQHSIINKIFSMYGCKSQYLYKNYHFNDIVFFIITWRALLLELCSSLIILFLQLKTILIWFWFWMVCIENNNNNNNNKLVSDFLMLLVCSQQNERPIACLVVVGPFCCLLTKENNVWSHIGTVPTDVGLIYIMRYFSFDCSWLKIYN